MSNRPPLPWTEIEEAFHAVLSLAPGERTKYLDDLERSRPELAAEARSLLTAHLSGPVKDLDDGPIASHRAPDQVGLYHIERPLGEGGMGTVYLAHREGEDFTQRVALKLIRAGFVGATLEERLRTERRILARLEHPGIARFIDGGTTPGGQPFLAMEYVKGKALHEYCDSHRLTIHDRLRLYVDVCDAVHYAHQQLVIHRDLKPNNILVTAEGRPKLLDFGIAKLHDQDPDQPSVEQTVAWFTPAYASPEQVRHQPISTLSDVYALGVILYELLTGRRPLNIDDRSPAEVERIICNDIPNKPSASISQPLPGQTTEDKTTTNTLSAARSATPERLRRQLSGDLDTIVLKALAKDPARRYASVEALAEDVRHYLHERPVLARPDSLTYRVQKMVRRHRLSFAAGLLIAVSMGAGASTALWQAQRATRQASIASGEAEKASLITSLMVDLFKLSDPSTTLGDTVTARQILDRGTTRIERDFGDQPDIQVAVFSEVARVYRNLGLLDRAEDLLRRTLALTLRMHGSASVESSEIYSMLGSILVERGKRDEAVDMFRTALTIRKQHSEAPDSITARIQSDLAWVLRDRRGYDEARELFAEALATNQAVLGANSPEAAASLLGLATLLHDNGSFAAAESLFINALADLDTVSGKPNPMAATALLSVGMIQRIQGRYQAAEPLLRSGVAMRMALYGPTHPEVFDAVALLAAELVDLGLYDEAIRVTSQTLREAKNSLGDGHPDTQSLRQTYASALTFAGRYPEAIAHFDTVLTYKQQRYGGDHADLMYAIIQSAEPKVLIGQTAEARTLLNEARAMGARLGDDEGVHRILVYRGLARVALRQGSLDQATDLFDSALTLAQHLLRPDHKHRLSVERERAGALIFQGRLEDAMRSLEESMALERTVLPDRHRHLGMALRYLSDALLTSAQAERAEQMARSALLHLERLPSRHWEVGDALSLVGAAAHSVAPSPQADSLMIEGHNIIRDHLGPRAPETIRAYQRLVSRGVSPDTAR